ncbi:MAG: HK97 family phage prohead protease, partial [Hyphococcus sp.]
TGVRVRMLYQHAAEAPIGRWTALAEDARGLFVRGEIILSSPRAREVYDLLAGGALDGLSIGYQTVKARKPRAGGRVILDLDLWEVSVVTFPMAPGARVTHVGAPRPAMSDPNPSSIPASAAPCVARALALTGDRPPEPPAWRALAPPLASARHFADALRSAAAILSV